MPGESHNKCFFFVFMMQLEDQQMQRQTIPDDTLQQLTTDDQASVADFILCNTFFTFLIPQNNLGYLDIST